MAAILTDYTFQVVALGALMMGAVSGLMGSFAVLNKRSLLGDGVSHAALPGVVLAFLLTGSRHTGTLLAGALVSGLLATLMMLGITRYSRIRFDSALALIMSAFFGLGLVLLTQVQKQPDARQAGLDRFIFGQASTLLLSDLYIMLGSGLVLMTLTLLFWKELKLFSFDREYAHILGFSTGRIDLLLSLMIVTAIIVGLQTVGVILMSAMLVAPAAAARQWTNRLGVMVLLSALFGGVSGLLGTFLSSALTRMPTGPAVVVAASLITLISLLLAPGRGVIARLRQQARNRKNFSQGGNQDVCIL